MQKFLRNAQPWLTAIGIFVFVFFSISPLLYYIGQWHCYWMPHVEACR